MTMLWQYNVILKQYEHFKMTHLQFFCLRPQNHNPQRQSSVIPVGVVSQKICLLFSSEIATYPSVLGWSQPLWHCPLYYHYPIYYYVFLLSYCLHDTKFYLDTHIQNNLRNFGCYEFKNFIFAISTIWISTWSEGKKILFDL